jgi:hypothetical protein
MWGYDPRKRFAFFMSLKSQSLLDPRKLRNRRLKKSWKEKKVKKKDLSKHQLKVDK